MKNEIKNPMERSISNEAYSYGNGGTGFICAECGEYCPCDNRCIDKDGREVCIFCYRNSIVTPERGNNPDDQIRKIRLASLFVSANGLTIACDHRMWEFEEHEIRNCMVRGIGWCSGAHEIMEDGARKSIQRPPDGEYVCHYVITPGMNPKTGWEAAAPLYPVGVGRSDPEGGQLELFALPDTTSTSLIGGNVKLSEDGSGIIVRIFESEGKNAELTLPGSGWQETDMLERNPVPVSGPLHFKPFEIKTLFLKQ